MPSAELKALEFLNSEPLRLDPRNHTIDVVESFHVHNFIFAAGTRRPSGTKYAVYDFGAAILYPEDTPLTVTNSEWQTWGWTLWNIHVPTEPYSPFQFDMLSLGWVLQRYVRVRFQ